MSKHYVVVIESHADCPMAWQVKEVVEAIHDSTAEVFAEFAAKRWNGKVISVTELLQKGYSMTFAKYIEMAINTNWTIKNIKGMFNCNSWVAANYFQQTFNAEQCLVINAARLACINSNF